MNNRKIKQSKKGIRNLAAWLIRDGLYKINREFGVEFKLGFVQAKDEEFMKGVMYLIKVVELDFNPLEVFTRILDWEWDWDYKGTVKKQGWVLLDDVEEDSIFYPLKVKIEEWKKLVV